MAWSITFYSDRIETEIESLAPAFVARFLRYAERMEGFGPDLGMPHTKAMEKVYSSCESKGRMLSLASSIAL